MNLRYLFFPSRCSPINSTWKILISYVFLAWLFTAYSLFEYNLILTRFITPSGLWVELAIAGAQIPFMLLFVMGNTRNVYLTYIVHLMTVSFLGALALWPMIVLDSLVDLSDYVMLVYFLLIAFAMFLEHFRRVRLLVLPHWLCLVWAVYRLIILLILL